MQIVKLLSPSTWFRRSDAGRAPATAVADTTLQPEALLKKVSSWNDQEPTQEEMLRGVLEFNKLVRSYEAERTSEYNQDFRGTYGTANTEIMPGIYTVLARTRTLVKDTPQGKVVQRTYQNNVIGNSLFKLNMRYGNWTGDAAGGDNAPPAGRGNNGQPQGSRRFVEEEETNTAIEAFWQWFVRQDNFTVRKTMSGMEAGRVVEASLVRDGRILCRLHHDYPGNEIKFAVDFLERDHLQESFMAYSESNGKFGPGNPIRGSVEYDKLWQFPLAYWLLVRHPGDALYGSANFVWGADTPMDGNYRVQVAADEIIDINNLRDRAEQDVGMTEFDAAVQPIWRNNQFTKALTLCAIASHIRAFVLEKQWPTGMEMPQETREAFANAMANANNLAGGDAAAKQLGEGQPVQTLRPGQERTLPYGVTAKVLAPEFPSEESHNFRLDNHREVAIATGVSYQHASGDYQNLGFIAGLMCQIPFQDWCKIRQTHLIECWMSRLFREALRAGILNGWFERRGYSSVKMSNLEAYCDAAQFKGKRWSFVNPLVQAQTLILLMQAGIMSPQQVQDELPDGVSIENLYTMIAEAKAEQEKHDIEFGDAGVTRPNAEDPVEEPKDGADNGKPPSKKKTSNPVRQRDAGLNHRGNGKLKIPMESLLVMSANGEH